MCNLSLPEAEPQGRWSIFFIRIRKRQFIILTGEYAVWVLLIAEGRTVTYSC